MTSTTLKTGLCLPALWLAALGSTHAAPTAPLNDTGVTQCMARAGGFHDRCPGAKQDADAGRDLVNNDNSDGHAGFSFQKIGSDGAALPAGATEWSCIADRVTGLLWEMKTDDGGLHDKDNKFTNWGDGRSANDSGTLVAAVNREGLCGRSDWRLPSRGELQGIVDYSTVSPGPSIDSLWFPYSDGYSFWTATGQVGNSAGAWYVNFHDGYTAVLSRDYEFGQVRLVSGRSVDTSARFEVVGGGEQIADAVTGLIWQRCSLGQTWDGTACTGRAQSFSWAAALSAADAASADSGVRWRVPNAKELASISDDQRSDPAIDLTAFPNTPVQLYWTSTPYTSQGPSGAYAWTVYSFDGSVTSQLVGFPEGLFKLRLVRSGR